ncbi:MAG: hypothetical protein ACFFCD_03985 [Promethearchaeota archaeon]
MRDELPMIPPQGAKYTTKRRKLHLNSQEWQEILPMGLLSHVPLESKRWGSSLTLLW